MQSKARSRVRLAAALLGAVAAAVPAAASEFENLARSRFVHCAFYTSYDVDAAGRLVLAEGRSDSLTHLQRIANVRDRARAIYTGVAGSRDVALIDTGKRLHFIDSMAGMYVVTTVYQCIERDEVRDACMTYAAMQARHFDSRVLVDPDKVFEEIRSSAEPGFCDYSFIGLREAAVEKP